MTPSASSVHEHLDLHVLGTVVRLEVAGLAPELIDRLRSLWHLCIDPPCSDLPSSDLPSSDPPEAASASPGGVLPAGGFRRLAEATDADARARELMSLTQQVTRLAIEAQTGTHLMFHAGALADPRSGASVVYVAPGGTGKTTLTRELGRARGYVTDETVAVTLDGHILPYPKPLSVRRAPFLGIKDETPPGDLGLSAPPVAPWVAGIVILRRDQTSAGSVVVEEVDLLEGISRLAPETSALARLHQPLRRLADLLDSSGGLQVLHYRDARDLEPHFQDRLEAAS